MIDDRCNEEEYPNMYLYQWFYWLKRINVCVMNHFTPSEIHLFSKCAVH